MRGDRFFFLFYFAATCSWLPRAPRLRSFTYFVQSFCPFFSFLVPRLALAGIQDASFRARSREQVRKRARAAEGPERTTTGEAEGGGGGEGGGKLVGASNGAHRLVCASLLLLLVVRKRPGSSVIRTRAAAASTDRIPHHCGEKGERRCCEECRRWPLNGKVFATRTAGVFAGVVTFNPARTDSEGVASDTE